MTTSTEQQQVKVRENRARRAAQRQRLALQKHRARDPRAAGFGTWQLVDSAGTIVAGDPEWGYGLTLDEIEQALGGGLAT